MKQKRTHGWKALVLVAVMLATGLWPAVSLPAKAATTLTYNVQSAGDGTQAFVGFINANHAGEAEVEVSLEGTLSLDETLKMDGAATGPSYIDPTIKKLTITGGTIKNALADSNTNAVFKLSGAGLSLTLTDVTLEGRNAHQHGFFEVYTGFALVLAGNTALTGNLGLYVGGVYVTGAGSSLEMKDSASIQNCIGGSDTGYAGGVRSDSGTSVTLRDDAFITGCDALSGGAGGILITSGAVTLRDNARIYGNRITGTGGKANATDVSLEGGTLTVQQNAQIGTTAGSGDGLGLDKNRFVTLLDTDAEPFTGFVNLELVNTVTNNRVIAKKSDGKFTNGASRFFYLPGGYSTAMAGTNPDIVLTNVVPAGAATLDLGGPQALVFPFSGDDMSVNRRLASVSVQGANSSILYRITMADSIFAGASIDASGLTLTKAVAEDLIAKVAAGLVSGSSYSVSIMLENNGGTPANVYHTTLDVTGVLPKPTVASITAPAAVDVGQPLTIAAPSVADNGTAITAQGWQISADGATGWVDFDTATAMTTGHNGHHLRYFATNSGGSEYSNTVQITVNVIVPDPVITQDLPVQLSPDAGEARITLAIVAENADGYQWYKDGQPIAGQCGASLTVNKAGGDGGYYVVVNGNSKTVQSKTCTVRWGTGQGSTEVIVKPQPGVPAVSLPNVQAVIDAVLTQAEKDEVAADPAVRYAITLKVEPASADAIAKQKAKKEGYTVWAYYSITLEKEKFVSDVSQGASVISAPSGAVQIVIAIPESLHATGRTFAMIRTHNGTAAVLMNSGSHAGSLTFETDLFSPYALVYKDKATNPPPTSTPDPEEPSAPETTGGSPQTGDTSGLPLWAGTGLMALMGFAVLAAYAKRQSCRQKQK